MTSNNQIETPIDVISVELAQVTPTGRSIKGDDPFLVTFDEGFDPENPKDWLKSRKWAGVYC